MAPNLLGTSALFLAEATASADEVLNNKVQQQQRPQQRIRKPIPTTEPQYKWEIAWRNVIGMIYLHVFGLYGFYLILFTCSWKTFFWGIFVAVAAGQGITAGAHRLWAHRCYKAKLPLRIILCFLQTVAFQNHLYEWVRDHRVHHKFTDSDADPHNAKRGFFFSHVGWLLVRKHKDVKIKGRTVDMSDMLADPVVRYQRILYPILMPICCFLIPTYVPYYYWNENFWVSWYVCGIFRYIASLHCTWLVNSAAHIYGNKPYDRSIGPTENVYVSWLAFGEGWHNYHHVFPWDYKAAELGNRGNFSTRIIDWFANMGWAYDLKTVPVDMINKRVKRTGDGSRPLDKGHEDSPEYDVHNGGLWGWGDKDMTSDDIKSAYISHTLE